LKGVVVKVIATAGHIWMVGPPSIIGSHFLLRLAKPLGIGGIMEVAVLNHLFLVRKLKGTKLNLLWCFELILFLELFDIKYLFPIFQRLVIIYMLTAMHLAN
jgi:hypothetical protein